MRAFVEKELCYVPGKIASFAIFTYFKNNLNYARNTSTIYQLTTQDFKRVIMGCTQIKFYEVFEVFIKQKLSMKELSKLR